MNQLQIFGDIVHYLVQSSLHLVRGAAVFQYGADAAFNVVGQVVVAIDHVHAVHFDQQAQLLFFHTTAAHVYHRFALDNCAKEVRRRGGVDVVITHLTNWCVVSTGAAAARLKETVTLFYRVRQGRVGVGVPQQTTRAFRLARLERLHRHQLSVRFEPKALG